MELNVVAASLLRRWYLVVAGLAMTTGLVILALDVVPPTYSATGSVVLLPPAASVVDGSNPLLQLGGLEQPAALVVAYLAGDEVRKPFTVEYPDTTYDVVLDPLSRGPLIIMTVESSTQSTLLSALDSALGEVPAALTNLQDRVGAPTDSRVESTPLSVDPEPTTVLSTTLRAMIAAAGLGLVGTLVGTVSLDRLLTQRRTRRPSRSVDDDEAESATDLHGAVVPTDVVEAEALATGPGAEPAQPSAPDEIEPPSADPDGAEPTAADAADTADEEPAPADADLSLARSEAAVPGTTAATPSSVRRDARRRASARGTRRGDPQQGDTALDPNGHLAVPWA